MINSPLPHHSQLDSLQPLISVWVRERDRRGRCGAKPAGPFEWSVSRSSSSRGGSLLSASVSRVELVSGQCEIVKRVERQRDAKLGSCVLPPQLPPQCSTLETTEKQKSLNPRNPQ